MARGTRASVGLVSTSQSTPTPESFPHTKIITTVTQVPAAGEA
ncbi:Uncharacterised protein [Amycolatopsis camponoti]|uniref:Uncharacterized protein n=1 Tax=Amycolatopsis camponoti TaxID=2606593 RepID=A0A6I8M575_9PSEU|nr:Uncharacterised protein [Amycolatopsis camponoti]